MPGRGSFSGQACVERPGGIGAGPPPVTRTGIAAGVCRLLCASVEPAKNLSSEGADEARKNTVGMVIVSEHIHRGGKFQPRVLHTAQSGR